MAAGPAILCPGAEIVENYFDDITFRIVAHRFKISGPESFATSESNSLEFIRSGEFFQKIQMLNIQFSKVNKMKMILK